MIIYDKVPFDQFDHEANKKLTLKDYDIHAHYVINKIHKSDLSLKEKNDALMMIEAYRFWIVTGNFVSSNIARVNYMVRNLILKEEEPFNRIIIKEWVDEYGD